MLCVFFIVVCLFCILYFICIFLLLLPTWRIKLMMMIIMFAEGMAFLFLYDADRVLFAIAKFLVIMNRIIHCVSKKPDRCD